MSGATPRARVIALALTASLLTASAGCGETRSRSVGPVALEVPHTWDAEDDIDPSDDLLAQARWRPAPDGGLLQVVVGCGDADADQLRQAMSEAYNLAADAEATAVEVPGLRSAQRIEWELRTDPMSGQAGTFQMAGLYGAGSGGLVVVELGAPAATFDAELAADVLASVEVDDDDLAERCRPQS